MGFGGIDSALGKAQHSKGESGAKEMAKMKGARRCVWRHMSQKGGSSNSGVKGTLVACLLGVVVEAAEAWHGWQKAK